MTKKQTISFTALPNGVAANGKLRLSAFISPRLWTDDPVGTNVALSEFPDWLDWPGVALTFQASFGGGTPVAASRVGDAPRSDLWKALFGPTTYLRPRSFDQALTETAIQSYSVRDVHDKLKTVYSHFAANNPTDFPTVAQLLDPASPLVDLTAPFVPVEPPPPGPEIKSVTISSMTPLQHFQSVESFHKAFSDTKVAVAPPDVEFHQMLAALGRYPVLMRMLGLVHDLEVDHPGSLGATTAQIIASWSGAPALPNVKTRCFVGANAFYATPRASSPDLSSDGLSMLKLDDTSAYELVQVNQDGAVIRTMRFTESLVRATFDPKSTIPVYAASKDSTARVYKTEDTPDAYSIPALTTAGLAVARVDRATKVTGDLATQADLNLQLEAGDVTFDAEDVIRGYAIDVYDGRSQRWHSLNERVGTYDIAGTPLSGIADEGWVSMGLTSSQDGDLSKSKLAETLFNWWGWSLSAPRPGKTMDADGNPVAAPNPATTQFDLSVEFAAKPGSLPRLRYGVGYRLRARAVDLAGNRTSRDAVTDFTHATSEVVFGRFEPVGAPEVVLDEALGPGDTLTRVVIRSNYDTDTHDRALRHIAPPKGAEPTLETEGVFDGTNGGVAASAYKLLAQKDGGSFVDIGKEDPNNPGTFYVKDQGDRLPYLPDLLSRGALWRGLPGTTDPVRVPFYGKKAWPDAQVFDLILQEGTGAPRFEDGPNKLNAYLDKGDVVEVRLSSFLDPDKGDIDRMALLRWLEEKQPAKVDDFRQWVSDGVHWMVTPFKTLTLVHAVRQPLLRPRFVGLTPTRAVGQTFVKLEDATMEVSRKSTSRLDILAQWSEPIDSLANPGPIVAHASARPFQFAVTLASAPSQDNVLDVGGQHEFHDTKYRHIAYDADATSRFAEYFIETKERLDLKVGRAVELHGPVKDDGIDWGGVVEHSEVVMAPDRSARYQRDLDYTMDYAKGRLTPLASLDGRTVNVSFIVPPIVRRTASSTELDIPSSARPDAPKVLYLIPTFGWSSSVSKDGTLYTSQRRGGGLRAYLDRPWYSSGDGELLGVVIYSAGTPTEAVKQFVSDWGLDPMYRSAGTASSPTVGAFKLATASKTSGLSLAELPGETALHVAGHQVGYDADRQLWYCDMEIDAGASYMPFVRLALARYQPHSVDGVHLSRVVLADFVQLTNDRTASITRDPKKSTLLNVTVSGLSYSKLQGADGPSQIEVSVERQRDRTDPNTAAELAWEPVPGAPAQLTPSAGPSGTTLWSGQLTLPKGPPDHFRVVIKEFEKFSTTPGDRRLVYADAIVV